MDATQIEDNENTEEENNDVNQLNKEIIYDVVQRDMDFLNESWAIMPELEVKQKDDEIACKDKSTSNDDSTTDIAFKKFCLDQQRRHKKRR